MNPPSERLSSKFMNNVVWDSKRTLHDLFQSRKASVEAVAAISLVEDYDTMIRRWTTTRFAASLRESEN